MNSLSFSCSDPVFDEYGRASIGVNQMPGGTNYPFSQPCELRKILADLYLAFEDTAAGFVRPFSVAWLYGFGCLTGEEPSFDPVHDVDMCIVDAEGSVVFDSRNADEPQISDWGTRLQIIQWIKGSEVLRVVRYMSWTEDEVPEDFDYYIYEPADAELEERTVQPVPLHVRSLRLDSTDAINGNIILERGYNTSVEVSVPTRVNGGRFETSILIGAAPGSGLGRFGPACTGAKQTGIRRINGIGPDARGNLILNATGCYRVDRPVLQTESGGGMPQARVQDHALEINNDCGACCQCQDFINVYEAIRRMRDRYADLVLRAQVARDLYKLNRERFLKQADCRYNDPLRVVLQPVCPNMAAVSIGYCHQGDTCLTNVVIPFSFVYEDTTGYKDPDDPTKPLSADTTCPSGGDIVCGSCHRIGNVGEQRQRGLTPASNELYTPGGAWPNYYVTFDRLQPGSLGSISFYMQFVDSKSSDNVELVADAYQVDLPQPVTEYGVPIPGYIPGEGPVGEEAKADHLINQPVKASISILTAPCCDPESLDTIQPPPP